MKRSLRREIIVIVVLALACAGMWFIPSPPPLAAQMGRRASARVLSVDNRELQTHGLLKFGTQLLTVKILNGPDAGEECVAANELRAQMELDKIFVPGDTAIVVMPSGKLDSRTVVTAQDHDRSFWLLTLGISFCTVLCVFGGWIGVKALLSFILSCLTIWKAVIPLVLRGWPASWTIFGAVCFLTAAILFLVSGINRKGIAAFAGAISGVFAGLCMAHGFTILMKINGAVLPYSQALIYCGCDFLDLQDIFTGAMILASSGAVMDLAMDISAGIDEVAHHSPDLPARQLISSGLRIGRSVVGTMTTTLLLAYSGGYITLLMMFCVQGNSPWEFLNNPLVASEAVKTLIGSFALVLVAPFTALAGGFLLARHGKSDDEEEAPDVQPQKNKDTRIRMTYQGIKKNVFGIIQPSAEGKLVSRLFDLFIMTLVLISVVSVFLKTFEISNDIMGFLDVAESTTMLVFSVEYLLRVWTADLLYPDLKPWRARLKFICSPMSIIDLIAILPFYLNRVRFNLIGLRTLRLIQFLRILKLNRYSDAFLSIVNVFRGKIREIMVSILFVLVLMAVSSLLIYYAEHDAQPQQFANAFSGLWWAAATLTTVGYGDIYPITPIGRLLGGIIALLGIGMAAIPTGILSAGFVELMEKKKREEREKNGGADAKEDEEKSPPNYCPHCGKKL